MRRIGSGTQGVVLEAEHPGYLNCTTRRALKVFEPSMFDSRRDYEDDLIYDPSLVNYEDLEDYDYSQFDVSSMRVVV